jgi:hypothetical protein
VLAGKMNRWGSSTSKHWKPTDSKTRFTTFAVIVSRHQQLPTYCSSSRCSRPANVFCRCRKALDACTSRADEGQRATEEWRCRRSVACSTSRARARNSPDLPLRLRMRSTAASPIYLPSTDPPRPAIDSPRGNLFPSRWPGHQTPKNWGRVASRFAACWQLASRYGLLTTKTLDPRQNEAAVAWSMASHVPLSIPGL